MSDNATLPAAGDSVRAIDKAGVKTQVTAIDIGGAGAEALLSAANPMPVSVGNFPATQAVSFASSPLPTGAATEATLAAAQALLNTLAGTIKLHNEPFVDGSAGQIMLAKRRDSDTTAVADGDLNILNMDEEGRLKVATKPANYAAVTGSIAAVAQTVFTDCTRFSNVMAHCSGTFSAVNCIFEGSLDSTTGSDGNWFTVQAIRSSANTIETTTGSLSAAPAYAWELSVNALKYFRVRCTARTSGTQNWVIIPGTYATEPIPGAQVSATQPVSGTLTSAGTTTNTPATPTASIVNSAATTNGTVVKASAGTIYQITASNTGAAAAFLKFHNSATVTAGTTAVALTIPIPASSTISVNFGALGMRYGTGICLSITNLAADTDTTAITANQVKVNTSYI